MRYGLAAILSVAFLAGCNAELDQYRQAQLGKPLVAECVLSTTRPAHGQKVSGRLRLINWQLPAIAGYRTAAVLIDTDGKVTAKLYSELVLEHWLVTQVGVKDMRFEADIPEEYFNEAPVGDRLVLQTEPVRQRKAKNVAGYLADVLGMFENAARSQLPEQPTFNIAANFAMVMFVCGRTTWPDSPNLHPEDFRGLIKNGFERVVDFGDGGVAIVRNLGGRRVQLDFKFFRIIDPFFLIPMIECSGRGVETKTVVRSGAATSPASQP